MRTIKFRGKVEYPQKYFGKNDIPNGKFIVGELHLNCRFPHIHTDKINKYPINPNTIGQFTGLHDQNCKDIYEGDIVRFPTPVNEGKYRIGYIGFHQLSASFRIITKSSDLGLGNRCGVHEITTEVIGNIYDNPELLQQF